MYAKLASMMLATSSNSLKTWTNSPSCGKLAAMTTPKQAREGGLGRAPHPGAAWSEPQSAGHSGTVNLRRRHVGGRSTPDWSHARASVAPALTTFQSNFEGRVDRAHPAARAGRNRFHHHQSGGFHPHQRGAAGRLGGSQGAVSSRSICPTCLPANRSATTPISPIGGGAHLRAGGQGLRAGAGARA